MQGWLSYRLLVGADKNGRGTSVDQGPGETFHDFAGSVVAHAAGGWIDDVLGVWPLHGLCGAWGGIACGIFGSKALGGMGGVSFGAQLIGTALGIAIALVAGYAIYATLKATLGLRPGAEEEYNGGDLSIHRITATPEREVNW